MIRRALRAVLTVPVVLLALVACSEDRPAAAPADPTRTPHTDADRHRPASPTAATPRSPSTSVDVSPQPSRTRPPADPRWRFYTDDHRWYASPWFSGRHQIMVPFGCTSAPYYDPDPSCPGGHGKHHGIDVAMPCGTPLTAGRPATVLDHSALGSAYGVDPVLLRVGDQDVVIGHTVHVYVQPGDRVAAGERFALAGDSGAPDGCHLHFEVRPAGADYTAAVDPHALLELTVAGRP